MRRTWPLPLLALLAFPCPTLAQTSEVRFSPYEDCAQRALELLDGAQVSVDVAQYNIRSETFHAKLDELRGRGVRVRIVVDAKNAANPWNTLDDRLEADGFALRRFDNSRSRYAIMHHKFTVIDGAVVLTGSYNWNGTAQHVNDENMLVLRDPALAAAYSEEFEELWDGRPDLPTPGGASGVLGSVRFSPEDRARDGLLSAIRGARSEILVAMFSLRDTDVARALRDAARRGVRVVVVTERKQADRTRADETVASGGARVIVGANTSSDYSAMHHKYSVIDRELVVSGACNWTYTAFQDSNEDMLFLADPALARRFADNFAALVRRYDPAGYDPADFGVAPGALASVHFALVMPATAPGDQVVVVGEHPALGAWDPARGLVLATGGSVFPTWSGRASLPAGARLGWKAVLLRADGTRVWELGVDRLLEVDASGVGTYAQGLFRHQVELELSAQLPIQLPAGAELRLVGDDPLLGSWDPLLALPLAPDPTDPARFTARVPLPGRVRVGAKLVLVAADDSVTWESGWDRLLEVEDREAQQVDLGAFRP
jgi:PLD-like domain/Starch binding domain